VIAGSGRFDHFAGPALHPPPPPVRPVHNLRGSEAGSYLRLIDSCITQLKAQQTCNESKEERERVHNLPHTGTHVNPIPFASRQPFRIFIEDAGPRGTARSCTESEAGLCQTRVRALPTETKVESGTSQSKSGTSVDFSNSGTPHGDTCQLQQSFVRRVYNYMCTCDTVLTRKATYNRAL